MTDNKGTERQEADTTAGHDLPEELPVYQKPVLRKYDQIEQVKPYGPSELEAG
jgi:hypothetical protein